MTRMSYEFDPIRWIFIKNYIFATNIWLNDACDKYDCTNVTINDDRQINSSHDM